MSTLLNDVQTEGNQEPLPPQDFDEPDLLDESDLDFLEESNFDESDRQDVSATLSIKDIEQMLRNNKPFTPPSLPPLPTQLSLPRLKERFGGALGWLIYCGTLLGCVVKSAALPSNTLVPSLPSNQQSYGLTFTPNNLLANTIPDNNENYLNTAINSAEINSSVTLPPNNMEANTVLTSNINHLNIPINSAQDLFLLF